MTGSELSIRAAESGDLAAVRQLLVETWHDTYDALIGRDKVTEITNSWHSEAALAAQLAMPQTSFLVAERDKAIVGHLFANGQRPPALYLSRLYVLPAFQRRGIGKSLLEAALPLYPEAEVMRLEVEADNKKGLSFYCRNGFEPVETHSSQGIAHVRMEKRLKP